MIRTSVQIEGMDDLRQKLSALVNEATSKREVQSALMFASNPMVKTMKARAPKSEAAYYRYYKGSKKLAKSGTLRKAIARKKVKLERSVGVAIYVRSRTFYWYFLEYGTPTMAAVPFLRNSFDNDAQLTLTRFKQKLSENIDKIKAKQEIAANQDNSESD